MTVNEALEWAHANLNERWRKVRAVQADIAIERGETFTGLDALAMNTLAEEVVRLRAEINRVASFLAIHGVSGYTIELPQTLDWTISTGAYTPSPIEGTVPYTPDAVIESTAFPPEESQ